MSYTINFLDGYNIKSYAQVNQDVIDEALEDYSDEEFWITDDSIDDPDGKLVFFWEP